MARIIGTLSVKTANVGSGTRASSSTVDYMLRLVHRAGHINPSELYPPADMSSQSASPTAAHRIFLLDRPADSAQARGSMPSRHSWMST